MTAAQLCPTAAAPLPPAWPPAARAPAPAAAAARCCGCVCRPVPGWRAAAAGCRLLRAAAAPAPGRSLVVRPVPAGLLPPAGCSTAAAHHHHPSRLHHQGPRPLRQTVKQHSTPQRKAGVLEGFACLVRLLCKWCSSHTTIFSHKVLVVCSTEWVVMHVTHAS